jgi:hypothetical protein
MTEVKTKRKPRKPKAAPEAASDLVLALRWMMLAQKSGSGLASYQTHCRIGSGWAVAFDGAVAVGHRVNVDWFACPQTERFLAALERSTEGLSLVVDESAITVKSGRLTVRVPCVDVLPEVAAPSPQAVGVEGPALLDAIRKVLPVCKESAATVLESSIELANGCATATDRICLLQAWHGVDIPRMILPRAAAVILLKQDGLTGIEPGADKVTFWFGPDKWLRFNLYDPTAYPNVARIFDVKDNALPLPEGFKEGVAALLPHVGDDGLIQLETTNMQTTNGEAKFNCDSYIRPCDVIFLHAERLKLVSEIATTADFDAGRKVIFYGGGLRGALSHAAK